MLDEIMKRIIRAAIEACPIDGERKARILRAIVSKWRHQEVDGNALR